ncbi:hypothetical protein F2P56_005237 [Juglans regia]|uniref:Reverse transcriptase/retrotransposon-derived protein RNase H-like domain-containing protein n=1 Tax=Juglans regia TaxID=51240 RepID=A0A834D6Q9_JUGRE|nr:hypothetical protein F2P56_005237 [Juglans regia]
MGFVEEYKVECEAVSNRLKKLSGHHKGMREDPEKLEAIVDWPRPETLKAVRGFLGLIGYYRRFIKNYGSIAAALTTLLKKNNFKWDDTAEIAFERLKEALTQPPVWALPNFYKSFLIECDASGKGVRAILMQ